MPCESIVECIYVAQFRVCCTDDITQNTIQRIKPQQKTNTRIDLTYPVPREHKEEPPKVNQKGLLHIFSVNIDTGR